MPQSCTICGSRMRWGVENAYLTEGSKAAIALCEAVGISQSAFYRHAKSHMALPLQNPPKDPEALDWTRAVLNLAKIPEKLIKGLESVRNLSILTGVDDVGPFVGLVIEFIGQSTVDWELLSVLESQYDVTTESDDKGIAPMFRIFIKLHAPSITVGRRNS